LCYNDNEGIPKSEWDSALIVAPDDPRFIRTPEGLLVHPLRDLHWEMGTSVVKKPREKCDDRMVRDSIGKVGNFSIPYGASGTALERLVEVGSGQKPAPGTGVSMIETWETRYPIAAAFQRFMEDQIEEPGWWRSPSGRIRHFHFTEMEELFTHRYGRRTSWPDHYSRQRVWSPIAREARNFPCQELVAATTGHAVLDFIEKRRQMGLKARVGILLYDAVTVFAPLEEINQASELMKTCLTTGRPWTINGRTFHFDVDVNYGFNWGKKPNEKEKEVLKKWLK